MVINLQFFPPPYDDELFSGACARYRQRCDNSRLKATPFDLFGSETACAVVDLPNRLDFFYLRLTEGTLLYPDRIIDEHTMLPLYRRFLPKGRLEKILSWMKGSGRGGSIHQSVGITASTVPHPPFLRFCLECLKDDKRQVGEAYWHRCHQVAGVLTCHIHGEWLWDSPFSITAPQNKHMFYLMPGAEVCNRSKSVHKEENHKIRYTAIATGAAWLLLSKNKDVPGLSWLKNRYLHFLRVEDIATYSGRVHQRELIERFNAHYGENFLEEINCPVDAQSEDNWLSKLVRKPRSTAHPLKHLLLMGLLGVGVEDFFETKVSYYAPFGRGPWPCNNPVSSHYQKAVIARCTITTNSGNGRPVGNFICSCGFCYARTGPDKERADRFRIGKMIQFGPVWEKELRNCRATGMGLRETARYLGVTAKTVKRHLDSINAGEPRLVVFGEYEEELLRRRASWSRLRASFPEAGRKNLRCLRPADYTWLYRHDREWLKKHLPPPMPYILRVGTRINWVKRDWSLGAKVVTVAKSIRSRVDKPVRVTVSSVGKATGFLFLLQNKLDKLPLTRQQLHKICEDRDKFDLRRVKMAAEKLKSNNVPLEVWKIARAANLSQGYSQAVKLEIAKLLEMQWN